MTLPLNRMTAEERERLCYAEGFTEAAKLFARIDELETAAEGFTEAAELFARIDELETAAGALLEALDDHYAKEKPPLGDTIEDAMGTLREVLP